MSWHVSGIRDRDGRRQIVDHNGDLVATVEWEADAPVIAAAPEMLAALRTMRALLNAPNHHKLSLDWQDRLSATERDMSRAIAKACGEECHERAD